jgi:hypothetical protein
MSVDRSNDDCIDILNHCEIEIMSRFACRDSLGLWLTMHCSSTYSLVLNCSNWFAVNAAFWPCPFRNYLRLILRPREQHLPLIIGCTFTQPMCWSVGQSPGPAQGLGSLMMNTIGDTKTFPAHQPHHRQAVLPFKNIKWPSGSARLKVDIWPTDRDSG